MIGAVWAGRSPSFGPPTAWSFGSTWTPQNRKLLRLRKNPKNSGARGSTPRPAAAFGQGCRAADLRRRGRLAPRWWGEAGSLQQGRAATIGLCAHGPRLAAALDDGVLQATEV